MSSLLALAVGLALLCAGGGLMLWQRAQQRTARERVSRFVDSRVAAASQGGAAGAVAGGAGGASVSGSQGVGAKHDAMRAAYVGGNASTRGGAVAGGNQAANAAAASTLQRWRVRLALAFQHTLSRAGIVDARKPLAFIGFVTVALTLWAFILGGVPAAIAMLAAVLACVAFALSMRMQRRRARLVTQLPSFLDGIVRLIVLGNSVPAAFQAALVTTEAPLRECLDHVSRMLRSGVEIDRALHQVSQVYRTKELELVGAVLRLSVRYGGRADVMLERMATFMRDLEQAQRELTAMSAETRLSAWVLALLPLGIAGFLILTNPVYFGSMWNDDGGRKLVYLAVALQVSGAFLLHRLTRLKGAL
ncbi:tight adherence protein B [Paraburkholderia bannensis]|uniref:Tight adherence protein B n=1 Tax=Paraburkholderia bannensis TaxID=765414 RepID=A0A7W9U2D7_9BURK|nr:MULTISPECIES: type II secretion system F family protein [Paraburkholderia]MBB3259574.1 tight adherence protein B [Paraburkholderia sp. WP4_3_2]MBB6104590.1 tight adherence protein B [Paraburkholderia bannensis]